MNKNKVKIFTFLDKINQNCTGRQTQFDLSSKKGEVHDDMTAYRRSRCTAPFILNYGTR
jgi:hypothetical protein